MKTKNYILITLIILNFLFIVGCKMQAQKLDCLNSIINENRNDADYINIEKLLKDTINNWINQRIELVQAYKHEKWKIDALIFNKLKNKCFIIIIEIDTNSTAKLDYVNYGVGQYQNNSLWSFYFAGITNLAVQKGNNFEELSIIAREELIKGGILKNVNCSVNDDYINGWFNQNLYNKQKKFSARRSL
jgi:hypothetical protein